MSVPLPPRKFVDPLKREWDVAFSAALDGDIRATVKIDGEQWETAVGPGLAIAHNALLWDGLLASRTTPAERLAMLVEAPGSIVRDDASTWIRLLKKELEADVNTEWKGRSALYRAVEKGLPARVEALLLLKARPEQAQSDPALKLTALGRAVQLGRTEIVELMVARGPFGHEEFERAADVLRQAGDPAIRACLTTLTGRFGQLSQDQPSEDPPGRAGKRR